MTGSVRYPEGEAGASGTPAPAPVGGPVSGGGPRAGGSERLDGEGGQAPIAAAIQDVTEKAQILIREEIELAKTEVEAKVRSLVRGAAIGAAAGIFALGALLLILHGLAWLAYDLLPIGDSSTFYVGFFFVALIFLILGAIAGFLAAKAFKKGSPPTPQLAIDEAKRIQHTVQTAGTDRGGTA